MKYLAKYISIAFLFFILLSCNKKLDVEPGTSIVPEQITNEADVEAVILGNYKSLQHFSAFGERYILIPDMLVDAKLSFVGTFIPYSEILRKQQDKTSSIAEGIWNRGYQLINTSNLALSKMDLVSDDNKAAFTAEAKFIRGITYFMLGGLFGKPYSAGNITTNEAVPLVLEPVLNSSDLATGNKPRATVDAVYKQVIEDLQDAAANLPADNGARANKFAAYAFLARVYMAQGNYAEAAAAANMVITEGNFTLATSFDMAFNNAANSPEDVFAIQQNEQSNAGVNNNGLTTFFAASPTGRGDVQVDPTIADLYEDGDIRKTYFYEGESITGAQGSYTRKWEKRYSVIPVVRLAEMYLTRAEANFRNSSAIGDTPLNDINAVRDRSNATAKVTLAEDDFIAERFRELAFEGDRYWTVKRLRLDVGSRPYDDDKLILPIPQRERDVNSQLTQNSGY
ncbi:RagB/SusD family nutrient uptake outer membrane protein [Chitinophaga japonensis]|uniref:SusD-like starch-binding protein associating with outer membrane n=1 Tax=Chitinophaga japonensis TaxID=104662 RepID=A0A562TFX0_CHIJA|nr:RagB/SusD family nutrient uptake outer membrane protein [Chitinophaga japonensis]TWI91860.1 SusD-like starch-binding protein associating with outer membrane [Chitinophaga japonensis]